MPPEGQMMSPKPGLRDKRLTGDLGSGRNNPPLRFSSTNAGIFASARMDNDRWLRQEVEREKSKIARFIETQERRQDNMVVREHGLLKKL